MINLDYKIEEKGRFPEPWTHFFSLLDSLEAEKQIVITFEGLIPPRDTHQSRMRIFRNRAGKVFLGKRKPSRETRQFLDALTAAVLKLAKTNHPALAALKVGPVALRLGLFYPWPKAISKARAATTQFKVSRPDADNLVKTIQDALTVREVIEDDSQVALLEVRKYNSPRPGLVLSLQPLSSQI